MRHVALWVIGMAAVGVCDACVAGEARPAASVKSAGGNQEIAIGEFRILWPVQVRNLAIFPIVSKSPKNEDRYMTLEEGLKAGKVQVYEVGAEPASRASARSSSSRQTARPRSNDPFGGPSRGASADVNHLMVVNQGDKPLYLMPGEIIYGGQQDRCMGQESIVQADGKPVKIEVFCVEHGRWSYRADAETQAAIGQLAGPNVDEAAKQKMTAGAKQGQFVLKAGNLSKAGRVAVQEGRGQQEVWNRVGTANAASGAETVTGAFTANYTSPEVTKQIDAYVKGLEKSVASRSQVVGAMVAVNGKIESVDVFGSTPLFQKVWPKLLRSHALDAAMAAGATKPAKQPEAATLAEAEKFFRAAIEGEVKQKDQGKGGLVVMKRESGGVVSFSASERSAAAPQAAGMGGFGGVHSSGYSK